MYNMYNVQCTMSNVLYIEHKYNAMQYNTIQYTKEVYVYAYAFAYIYRYNSKIH